ncbi:hypothetical protein D3C76_789270 [compost metagenome]
MSGHFQCALAVNDRVPVQALFVLDRLAGIEQVGLGHVQIQAEALLDCRGQGLLSERLQFWQGLEQLRQLRLVFPVQGIVIGQCTRCLRILRPGLNEPGRWRHDGGPHALMDGRLRRRNPRRQLAGDNLLMSRDGLRGCVMVSGDG